MKPQHIKWQLRNLAREESAMESIRLLARTLARALFKVRLAPQTARTPEGCGLSPNDAERREQFFLALSLSLGRPKPFVGLRHTGGGKGPAPAPAVKDVDLNYLLMFLQLAFNHFFFPKTEGEVQELYDAYERWYGNYPD
jgi:hypothetical protein